MFENELKKYRMFGNFSFKVSESLAAKCNAPPDKGGVYLICKITDGVETLIYIGKSGRKNKDGGIKIRKGGMKDRLINGHHPKFGKIKRSQSFPVQMQKENISELKFYWWVTYEGDNYDYPTEVENQLIKKYETLFKRFPDWHK